MRSILLAWVAVGSATCSLGVDMPICSTVSPAWNYTLPDWMSTLPDCVLFSELSMASAHDAGVSDDSAESSIKAWIIRKWCICQDGATSEQVELGIRFFDLRFEKCDDDGDINDYKAVHEIEGQELGWTLDSLNLFLNCHPREFLVLRFSHWNDESEQNECLNYVRGHAIANHFLYCSDTTAPNLNALTLGELRGKALVVVEWKGSRTFSPAQGIWTLATTSGSGILGVHDSYSNKDSFDEMWSIQQANWASRASVSRTDSLYMLCWQRTLQGATGIGDTNYERAEDINPRLASCLAYGIACGWGRPNLVNADFIDENLNRTIINLNLDVLYKTPPVDPDPEPEPEPEPEPDPEPEPEPDPEPSGITNIIYNAGTCKITGGIVCGTLGGSQKILVTGGAFNEDPAANTNAVTIPPGYESVSSNDMFLVGGIRRAPGSTMPQFVSEADALAAGEIIKVVPPNADVAGVVSEADYAVMYDITLKPTADGWTFEAQLKDSVTNELQQIVDSAKSQSQLVQTAANERPQATIQTKAGLYYGIASATEPAAVQTAEPENWQLGDGEELTIEGRQPSRVNGKAFFQLRVTPNPNSHGGSFEILEGDD